jgi:hypothetical protein
MVSAVIAALHLPPHHGERVADRCSDDTREPVRVPFSTGVAIALCAAFTLVVGLFPALADRRLYDDKVVDVARPLDRLTPFATWSAPQP